MVQENCPGKSLHKRLRCMPPIQPSVQRGNEYSSQIVPWWRQRTRDWWHQDSAAGWEVLSQGRCAASAAWSSRVSLTSSRSRRPRKALPMVPAVLRRPAGPQILPPAGSLRRRAAAMMPVGRRRRAAHPRSATAAAAAAAVGALLAVPGSENQRWSPSAQSRPDTRKKRRTSRTTVCWERVELTILGRMSQLLAMNITRCIHYLRNIILTASRPGRFSCLWVNCIINFNDDGVYVPWPVDETNNFINKKLSCRQEAARRSVSLKI